MTTGRMPLATLAILLCVLALGHCCPKKILPKKKVEIKYDYKGCYIDRKEDRDMKKFHGYSPEMTLEECSNRCKQEPVEAGKAMFLGLQNGDQCHCGQDFGKHGRTDDFYCQTFCSGSRREFCGGQLYNSVYTVGREVVV